MEWYDAIYVLQVLLESIWLCLSVCHHVCPHIYVPLSDGWVFKFCKCRQFTPHRQNSHFTYETRMITIMLIKMIIMKVPMMMMMMTTMAQGQGKESDNKPLKYDIRICKTWATTSTPISMLSLILFRLQVWDMF